MCQDACDKPSDTNFQCPAARLRVCATHHMHKRAAAACTGSLAIPRHTDNQHLYLSLPYVAVVSSKCAAVTRPTPFNTVCVARHRANAKPPPVRRARSGANSARQHDAKIARTHCICVCGCRCEFARRAEQQIKHTNTPPVLPPPCRRRAVVARAAAAAAAAAVAAVAGYRPHRWQQRRRRRRATARR